MNEVLRTLCMANTDDLLTAFGGTYNKELGYTFIDRGSNVLAICHLDVVDDYDPPKFHTPRAYTEYEIATKKIARKLKAPWHGRPYTLAESIALDDRLGLYVIMELLPRMGVQPDILLTTGEEMGRPTGRDFVPPRQYNWMFQFDRHGNGNVMYQYQDETLVSLLESNGYIVERGTFSDISVMEHLGCKGINFGVGYEAEHNDGCYCNLQEVYDIALKFSRFFSLYEYTAMPHTPTIYKFDRKTGGRYGELWRWNANAEWEGTSDKFYLNDDDKDYYDISYCISCGMDFSNSDLLDGLCLDCIYTLEDASDEDDWRNDPWENDK